MSSRHFAGREEYLPVALARSIARFVVSSADDAMRRATLSASVAPFTQSSAAILKSCYVHESGSTRLHIALRGCECLGLLAY